MRNLQTACQFAATYPVIHENLALLFPFGLLYSNRSNRVQCRNAQFFLSVYPLLLLHRATLLCPWRRRLALGRLLRFRDPITLRSGTGLAIPNARFVCGMFGLHCGGSRGCHVYCFERAEELRSRRCDKEGNILDEFLAGR